MFDSSHLEWPPPPVTAPPEEVIDCLVEDFPGAAEPVRWSEYLPDGMLADLLAQPAQTDPEHREFETLERVGAWERVIAWAQARQVREMASFMHSAPARNKALGACDSQAHDSAVAEVGLMLAASARTAACRVGDAWSLCTRLPATLAAMESGRITLTKARILDTETLNLSADHTAAVEAQGLAKAPKQTPGQLRAATRRAVLSADPTAARERAKRARRERGVQMWPGPRWRAAGHRGSRESRRGGGEFSPDTTVSPVVSPRPELRRHRPGRQAPASEGSVKPPISGGKDVTTCFPPRYGDGLSIPPSDRSGRVLAARSLCLCPRGSGNATAGWSRSSKRHHFPGVARRGGR